MAATLFIGLIVPWPSVTSFFACTRQRGQCAQPLQGLSGVSELSRAKTRCRSYRAKRSFRTLAFQPMLLNSTPQPINRTESSGGHAPTDLAIAISEFAPTSKIIANKREWAPYALKKVAERE